MEKDKIFFSSNGLTTTSANHVANLCKEAYKDMESALNNAAFYTTTIGLLGSSSTNILREGVGSDFLDSIEDNLMRIAQLKSLIAWLREAIKAKERLIREASNLSNSAIAEVLNLEFPAEPAGYERITEDDVVGNWGIKQRNRYYYLDTLCSTIGTYIHPDRHFSNAKDELVKIVSEPHSVSGNGRDMVIYTKTPTVSVSEVNDVFFSLQEKYRGYQAELNSLKHSIEVALQEDDREKSQKEIEENKNYQAAVKTLFSQITAYRKEQILAAQSLKIVIPDSLKPIYDFVSKMGKDKS